MRRTFTRLAGTVSFLLFTTFAFAQNISIKGKVSDGSNGETLPGVSVTVKGTTNGTQTDANGQFALSVPGNGTLVFSYIGFQNQELPVNNQTTFDVKLKSAATELEQVVVVGYGTQRKVDVTGAVAQVKGEEISKQSSPNAVSALQGKVAGVQITNSGSPGASPEIRVRGTGTVYGNANPLYVVDGVWFDDISFLNPADIENISILKDASSEAIYGVRAANGVVLVTTKKGKGKASVNYSGYFGFQQTTNLVKMANATEYATLINELSGAQTFPNPSSLGAGTNWYDQVLRSAPTMNHHLSISGGTEKSTYNFSVGYLQQDGVVKGNNFDRITARLQNDIQVTDFLKVGYNAAFQNNASRDVPTDVIYKAYTAAPIVPVFNADGSYGNPLAFPIGDATNNPQAQLDFFNQKTKNNRINGNAFADINILKELKFRTSFGGDFGESEVRNYNPVYYATPAQRNDVSILSISRSQVRNWIWENTLSYDKTIGDHKFTILAGQTAQRMKSYNLIANARNVPFSSESDLYLALGDNTADSPRSVSDGGELITYNSYFGRVNYSFADKYLINASFRRDGSSKFIGDQRWGNFPAVGAGWVISKEEFMQDQKVFDDLKLRASWGKVGNAGVPANLSVLTVNNQARFIASYGNGVYGTGQNISAIVPPVTYWERGQGTDIGLEGALLNNRLSFEFDWYMRDTKQAIFAIPLLGSLGADNSQIIGNQADFRNQGWEFNLNWRDEINDKFSYSVGGNFTINNNKVLSAITGNNPIYGGGAAATGGQLSTRTIVGQPIGQFYGLQVVGVFQNAAEIADSAQPSAQPGDFRYQDTNGDGFIDAKDRVVIGNPNPRYTFGLNTSFSYANFDLAVDVQGVTGVDIYNANKGLRFGSENYSKDFFDHRWSGSGTSNSYPSANIGGGTNYIPNSWYVENGSYLRFRNIQLGYTFPSSFTQKIKIQRLRIYANAQNAINFFKYTGFSPEVGSADPIETRPTLGLPGSNPPSSLSAGIDNGIYPLFATYNFGLNITF
ncbi:MAG: TonB-dependent receptor [Mucilaginibacter polytrichastri]|nr:TonB-dependent receptor [Mucilaginibacter polytrichastri]